MVYEIPCSNNEVVNWKVVKHGNWKAMRTFGDKEGRKSSHHMGTLAIDESSTIQHLDRHTHLLE